MNKCLFSCRPIEPEVAATKWRRTASNTHTVNATQPYNPFLIPCAVVKLT